jgi:hypothetical protein
LAFDIAFPVAYGKPKITLGIGVEREALLRFIRPEDEANYEADGS